MKPAKIHYFAYGANLSLAGMNLRCPGHQPICRAVLKNYRLTFKGVADIEPAKNQQVHGALYKLTPIHLQVLDSFEGYPRLYIRKTLPVFARSGKQVDAIVYLMNDYHQYASPSSDYLTTILSGCRQWKLPEEHIHSILANALNPHPGEF